MWNCSRTLLGTGEWNPVSHGACNDLLLAISERPPVLGIPPLKMQLRHAASADLRGALPHGRLQVDRGVLKEAECSLEYEYWVGDIRCVGLPLQESVCVIMVSSMHVGDRRSALRESRLKIWNVDIQKALHFCEDRQVKLKRLKLHTFRLTRWMTLCQVSSCLHVSVQGKVKKPH